MSAHNFNKTNALYIAMDSREIVIHTVPIETPQSMFEDPSNGSKTTQYLKYTPKRTSQPKQTLFKKSLNCKAKNQNCAISHLPRFDGSTIVASSSSSDTRMHWQDQKQTRKILLRISIIRGTKKNICIRLTYSTATAYQSLDENFIGKHIQFLLLFTLQSNPKKKLIIIIIIFFERTTQHKITKRDKTI